MGVQTGMLVLLVQFGILLMIYGRGQSQNVSRTNNRRSETFNFNIDPKQIFQLNRVLGEDTEYSHYILKRKIYKYKFILKREHMPLTIRVTPCISRLDWNLTLSKHTLDDIEDNGFDDLNTQTVSQYEGYLEGTQLQRYNGDDIASYSTQAAVSGIYILSIRALDSDSVIKLFASTSAQFSGDSRNVPKDTRLVIKQKGRRRFTVSWKPDKKENRKVQYCVGVNKKKNFKSYCGFHSYAHGDKAPIKKHAFFFRKQFEQMRYRAAPVKAAPSDDYTYKCFGNKTSYSFKGVKEGQTYYVDLYTIVKATKEVISHYGAQFRSRNASQSREESTMSLVDGKAKFVVLKRSMKSQKFVYDLKTPAKQLMFSLYPCVLIRGSIRVKLYTKHSLIKKVKVKSLEYFTIEDAQPNQYFVKVSIKGRKARPFTILATTRPSKYMYPKLPENTMIKVYDESVLSVTCNSVTLGWFGTEKRQKYCLYKRELNLKNSSACEKCEGPKSRKKSEKVLCTYFRHRNKKRPKTEKVSDLKPGTDYTFDVFVIKRRLSLQYLSVTVRTKERC